MQTFQLLVAVVVGVGWCCIGKKGRYHKRYENIED